MQEFAREGHFFWDFTDRKWGFFDFQPAECSLQGKS